MILKARPEDFRVVETLDSAFLEDKSPGEKPYFVYRVTKRKLTTLEAITIVAQEAGVEKSEIGFAGLKDRQGITVQHFSVRGGRELRIDQPELKVALIARTTTPVSSQVLRGNLFDVMVRSIGRHEWERFRDRIYAVRRFGAPNYFDDQRFGCVRHGQGFIVRELIRGRVEEALRRVIASISPYDSPQVTAWKSAMREAWGDWDRCVAMTKGRDYESLFRHLQKNPGDWIGAFCFISQRVRLIHLYAYQSYLWNKMVSVYLKDMAGESNGTSILTDIGPLFCPRSLGPTDEEAAKTATFPLLDPHAKAADERQQRAIDAVLKLEGLTVGQLQVEGIPGFVFKGEQRPLFVVPGHMRVRPPEPDERFRERKKVGLRFSLPPGSYATIVLKCIFASDKGDRNEDDETRKKEFRPGTRDRRNRR